MADIVIPAIKIEGTILVRDKDGNIKAELRLVDKDTAIEEATDGADTSNSPTGRPS